ncbi:tripartite tricarboxylate transporter substrate binding protein [Siccirubricoccus sp. G192]|uniref:Bug family tripartite tricarboxylate transporter substrate binding protein n=1 Tax=Siccirubricoccus sp. G192 TaxID=2849651 RepID=UPI001C2CAE2F|nr:tripartite tricarboxylate transporter substrate binding protein [Siccirubricoccus sp. G192]MBV1797311.1 tripartite tricarboxylate transporter substrate binding protein [Siccirubricoccus sp. G192]
MPLGWTAPLLALLALLWPVPGPAQTPPAWPTERPVRLIIAWPPGGTTDFVTRLYARQLGEALGQSFVVENRPGGGGSIAWRAVAGARPDGYTLLLSENSIATAVPLMPDLGLDMRRDFTPLALLVDYPSVLAVPAAFPARNLAELLAQARSRPGELNFGSMGNGSSPHLYMEVLQDLAQSRMTHVPYRGMGPAFNDLIAGRLQVVVAAPPTVLGAVRGGTVRVLAIGTAGGRIPALPDAPTLRESGIDFAYSYWYGLFGPKGLDPAIAPPGAGRGAGGECPAGGAGALRRTGRRADRPGRRRARPRAGGRAGTLVGAGAGEGHHALKVMGEARQPHGAGAPVPPRR